MVDLHKIKPRLQSPILAQVLTQYPVVVVHGARQTGKTTLVQESPIDQGRTFLSLDDFDVRDVAQSDPAALFIGRNRITLDEIQRQPDLLLAIKADVDRQRQPGRFLLTVGELGGQSPAGLGRSARPEVAYNALAHFQRTRSGFCH